MTDSSSAAFLDGVAYLMCLLRGQALLLIRMPHTDGLGYINHIWYGILIVFRK